MTQPITIIKCDHQGQEVLRYQGIVQYRDAQSARVLAYFSLKTRDLGYVTLKTGDEFTEWFYADQWYNVFRIHDVDDASLKGWYCNFTRPAHITRDTIQADDLALDFFVYPDRRVLTLDQDEYDALPLTPAERHAVESARTALRQAIARHQSPFD